MYFGQKKSNLVGLSAHRVYFFLKKGRWAAFKIAAHPTYFTKKVLWAETQVWADLSGLGPPPLFLKKIPYGQRPQPGSMFFGQKKCHLVGLSSLEGCFFKKKGGGPSSRTRPTPLVLKKNKPWAETQVWADLS